MDQGTSWRPWQAGTVTCLRSQCHFHDRTMFSPITSTRLLNHCTTCLYTMTISGAQTICTVLRARSHRDFPCRLMHLTVSLERGLAYRADGSLQLLRHMLFFPKMHAPRTLNPMATWLSNAKLDTHATHCSAYFTPVRSLLSVWKA